MRPGPLLMILMMRYTSSTPLPFIDDLVCNNGTEHACICQSSIDRSHINDCTRLIKSRQLAVIAITIPQLDLRAVLTSGEPYERYFKRQFAQLISRFCEHKANDCPGTELRLSQYDLMSRLYMDEDNILILAVSESQPPATMVQFVVTRMVHVGSLTPSMIMNASRVIQILSGSLDVLERRLGGVKIVSLREEIMYRLDDNPTDDRGNDGSNTLLLSMVGIIVLFFIVVYIIAIYKVCKDYHQRRRLQIAKHQQHTKSPSSVKSPSSGKRLSYGTIPHSDSAGTSGVNGVGLRRESIPIRVAPPPPPGAPSLPRRLTNQHPQTDSTATQFSTNHFTIFAEPPITSSIERNFFVCDESQLPEEHPLPPLDVLVEGIAAKRPSINIDQLMMPRSATAEPLSTSGSEPQHPADLTSLESANSDDDGLNDASYYRLSPNFDQQIVENGTVDDEQPPPLDNQYSNNVQYIYGNANEEDDRQNVSELIDNVLFNADQQSTTADTFTNNHRTQSIELLIESDQIHHKTPPPSPSSESAFGEDSSDEVSSEDSEDNYAPLPNPAFITTTNEYHRLAESNPSLIDDNELRSIDVWK